MLIEDEHGICETELSPLIPLLHVIPVSAVSHHKRDMILPRFLLSMSSAA
jgi:hypothetical protein